MVSHRPSLRNGKPSANGQLKPAPDRPDLTAGLFPEDDPGPPPDGERPGHGQFSGRDWELCRALGLDRPADWWDGRRQGEFLLWLAELYRTARYYPDFGRKVRLLAR